MELTHDCGSGYQPGALLCPGCGDILGLDDGPGSEPATEPRPVAERDRARLTEQRDCAVCGRPPTDGGTVCLFCGSDREPTGVGRLGEDGGHVVMVLPDGVRVPVADGVTFVLGRESSSPEVRTALAAFDAVSRRHTELTRRGSRIAVRDLGSTNGTFVDGMPITEVELSSSAVLGLGRSLTLPLLIREEGPTP